MVRILKLCVGLVVVVVLAFVVVGSTRAAEEPQVVRVTFQDNQVDLSQVVVASGKAVRFVVTNSSLQPHQFVVEPYGRAAAAASGDQPVIGRGTTWTFDETLKPGVYRVGCTNPDHIERGITTALSANPQSRATFPVSTEATVSILALVLGAAYIIGDSMGLRVTRAQA